MKTKPINVNHLAEEIAKYEGGKVNLSIAQIKEVLRITLILLGFMMIRKPDGQSRIYSLLSRYNKRWEKMQIKYDENKKRGKI